MLRVAEQYAGSDTGRQRRANEDSLLARAPLFVVADGMGGAQAGEVASRIAVESFEAGVARQPPSPRPRWPSSRRQANARIHELSHSHAEQAGMGTTLDGRLRRRARGRDRARRRQPRLPPARRRAGAADRRPFAGRRAAAPGPPDARGSGRASPALGDHARARAGGRRSRSTRAPIAARGERRVPAVQRRADDDGRRRSVSRSCCASTRTLRDAGEALIAAANEAGGRDNITVVLLRVEELDVGDGAADRGSAGRATARRGAAAGRRDACRRRRGRGDCDGHGRARRRRAGRAPSTAAAAEPPRRAAPALSAAARAGLGVAAGAAGADRGGRLSRAAVGLLHRHQRTRSGDGVPRRARTRCPAACRCTKPSTSRASPRRSSRRSGGTRCSTTRCAPKATRPR